MIVLALDIATNTGHASDDPANPGRPTCGAFRCERAVECDGGGKDYGPTFASFDVWLRAEIARVRPDVIAFEAPLNVIGVNNSDQQAHAAGRPGRKPFRFDQNVIRILFGLVTIAELQARLHGVDCVQAAAMSIKKYFAGTARADKSMMLARSRQLGWPARTFDEADACGLWAMTKSTLEPRWAPMGTPLFGRPR